MKHSSTPIRCIFTAGLTALVLGPAANPALAAPGALSQAPLYVGSNVEPNVVFLNDDSGSMGFTVMTPGDSGYMWVNEDQASQYYYMYTHPRTSTATNGQRYTDGSTPRARVVPTEESLASSTTVDSNKSTREAIASSSGVWRAWNHNYNKIYYNPNITYTPWVGVNKSGIRFSNVDPTKALVNPYDPSLGYENLTVNMTYSTWYKKPSSTSYIDISNITLFPARYYIWSDTNSNGIVDATDDRELVEIKPARPLYPRAAGRRDCTSDALKLNCTYAEEIQNFANWFSYYRSRDFTAKNATTAAIEDITGIRVGFATINEDSGARNRVASMNLDPTTGNKRKLFDGIYSSGYQFTSSYAKGTPLRIALHKTGLYYEGKSNNIMGSSATPKPILPAAQGGMCQKNYTILMTDGFWSDSSNPGISSANADGNNNTAWDGPPYGDSYSYTLADVAMHYYERDLDTSLPNEVPARSDAKDKAPHQHMTTYTVAFGVSGTLDPEADDPSSPGFNWPSPFDGELEKIDDLWHAAYNGRGEFYNAQDPEALQAGLKAAFASVARGKSSSASVAFNTTRLGTDSMLYQASFNPSDNWAGSLVGIELSIEGQLGGIVWDAASKLDEVHPNNRLILTYNEDTKQGTLFKELMSLSTRQQNDLNTAPDGSKDGLGQARLDFLRGDRSNEGPDNGHEFRQRTSILGDIVYSNPVFVGRPESGYDDDPSFGAADYSNFLQTNIERPAVIYVGSNDGMLHGFLASNGEPAISYVPGLLASESNLEGLHYLTDPNYEHRYYVDLSPTVADAVVNGSWRTVLVGGFRAGGKGLFALDVTHPQNFNEASADSIVMWEFTHPDMGYSFSKPTIAQLQSGEWAAVFGNGYNSGTNAKLFMVDISSGQLVMSPFDFGAETHGLSTPVLADANGDGKVDRIYAGDLAGNIWVVHYDNGSWKKAFSGKPLFTATIGGVPQPITSKPVLVRNPLTTTPAQNLKNDNPNILVLFGTGQYMVDGDKTSTDTQTFYGVWDNGSKSRLTRSDLVAQAVTDKSTPDLRNTTDHPVDYGTKYGWYLDLPVTGERVVVDPKVRGLYVFFNTLIPDTDSCSSAGSSFMMSLKYANGGNPNKPVFDVNNDGVVDEGDLIDGTYSPSGVRMENILAGSNFLDDLMYTPDDEGNIDVRRIDDGIDDDSGRISWREVRR
jgi:type IV pilus assembly protein PilY1